MSEQPYSTEERLLAAISHALAVTQGIGILVGILVYITQREKQRFAAFQALQAAVYQIVTLIAVIGVWFCWGVFYALSFIPIMQMTDQDAPPPIFWISLGSMVIPFALMIAVGLYGLWGVRTWQGRDFRYIGVGSWLERSGLWKPES